MQGLIAENRKIYGFRHAPRNAVTDAFLPNPAQACLASQSDGTTRGGLLQQPC